VTVSKLQSTFLERHNVHQTLHYKKQQNTYNKLPERLTLYVYVLKQYS